jgi:hypothetical protein
LVLTVLVFVGCMDDSSNLNSPDIEINSQSNSPNFVKLPVDLGGGFGVETEHSAEKLISGRFGGIIKLYFRIPRPGHEFGDFVVKAKVKVKRHSFPDNEVRLFTITMDPENAFLNISPSPNTLSKHVIVDWEIKGIDVSDINPETFDFCYIGDNNEMLATSRNKLKVHYYQHKIQLKRGIIYPTTPEDTPGGIRYAFIR